MSKILITLTATALAAAVGFTALAATPVKAKPSGEGETFAFTGYGGDISVTRPLHYRPTADGTGAMTVNGTRKYNRGLYGAHSGFRVDASDMPEFGIYLPRMGGNLKLTLPEGDCTAVYTPGRMDYTQGGVTVEAQVGRCEDIAIWKITNTNSTPVEVGVRFGGVADKKFSREGDLGVDAPDCFDLKPEYCKDNIYRIGGGGLVTVEYGAKERKELKLLIPADLHGITELPSYEGVMKLKPGETRTIALWKAVGAVGFNFSKLSDVSSQLEEDRQKLASSLTINTPDEWLNPVGGALAVAADGIWSGQAWLHGSIGWRTPHLGWRGAYAGDAMGWHDRALTHFRTYAANQVTDIPPTIGHPVQDSTLNLARAEKRWGTPMYSNGYICRRPGKKDEMSHYDMNLVYIDAMLRHFRHTADTAAMRELFPVVKLHLDWEKRNFDPDGDHLYDGYCCIWASDALYYSGGAATHSTAYNLLANKIAADVAEAIGEDSTPYRTEAEAIREAMEKTLWMPERGHWAEYKDLGHHERLHPAAALWTLYHAIDSEVADPFKTFAATTYIDREIPHIPVRAEGIDEEFVTVATTNWKPYSWSINNVAIAEVMHTALAYWQAGRPDEAYRLMKGTVMDNMYIGGSPLNFGQISQYDTARGECYRDFADPIGVWGRALTEGLYGIRPNRIGNDPRVDIIPGFPSDWNETSIDLPDLKYSFKREGTQDTYTIDNRYPKGTVLRLVVPASGFNGVRVNGKMANYYPVNTTIGEPRIEVYVRNDGKSTVIVDRSTRVTPTATGNTRREGPVAFTEYSAGPLTWWEAKVEASEPLVPVVPQGFDKIRGAKCVTVDISDSYNANVADIFNQQYLSPRPQVTTLQLPTQGMGEWCHPKDKAEIDDSGLRKVLADNGGVLITSLGIPFRMAAGGKNVAYTSLWDNYPESVTIPLSGRASHLYLAMAGSTNHMQWGMENGLITVTYTDGTKTELPLVPPVNWAPIEQDYFTDDYAFRQPNGAENPYRLHLATGNVSRTLADDLGFEEVYGRRIEGGAAVLVDVPVNQAKKLKDLTLTTLSHDVVMGVMGITIQR